MGMKNVSSEILLRRDFFSGVCEYHIEDTRQLVRGREGPLGLEIITWIPINASRFSRYSHLRLAASMRGKNPPLPSAPGLGDQAR